MVNRMTEERSPAKIPATQSSDSNVKAAVEELERFLGTRVRIVERGPHRGRIEIEYYSMEDLHRIYSQILGDEVRTG
jgi:ParB family chromosome partitioning protein